jgi:glycosidase
MLTQEDIIYFVVTDRFYDGDKSNNFDYDLSNPEAYHGGDFAGLIDKIPYLKHLGITALWITPAYVNMQQPEYRSYGYHGYWPYDFSKVDCHLYTKSKSLPDGSKRYLKKLVDAMHANGIKVILDMVVNHTGYRHPGLHNDPDTPIKADWFNPDRQINDQKQWLAGMPDLNQDNPEVVDYFINTIIDWIEATGIDCIRMDTAKNVDSTFWYHYKTYVRGRFPDVSLLGEILDFSIDTISEYQRHFAFDSLFDFPLYKVLNETIIHDAPLTWLSDNQIGGQWGVLDKDTHYTNHNRLVTLLDNHDLPQRFMTAALDRYHGQHDGYPKAAHLMKLALTLLFTTRGIPQLYYGTEVGLQGNGNHDNRRDMPWYLFGEDLIPTNEYPVEREIFLWTKQMIDLRKANPALAYGSLLTLYADQYIYAFLREFRGNNVVVVLNNGHEPMPHSLPIHIFNNTHLPNRVRRYFADAELRNLLDPSQKPILVKEGKFSVKLPGKHATVLQPYPRHA